MSEIDGYRVKDGQGGLEAASRSSRELATWEASPLPTNLLMLHDKDIVSDRARDVVLNDGYASGAVAIHKDNIVGNQFRLNARPDAVSLGIDDAEWLQKFQFLAEARFNGAGESVRNWFDVSGTKDFTAIIRQAIGTFLVYGEVVGVFEWLDEPSRPFSTAIQFICPNRLCNPDTIEDNPRIQSGVERNRFGRPIAYYIRQAQRFDYLNSEKSYQWKRIAAETAWGRPQVLHVFEQLLSDQTRGISEMVSVLKQMRMTRRFQDVELQQAVLQASYAATIESDLPPNMLAEVMGANPNAPNFEEAALSFLNSVARHKQGANIHLNGARIPILHPNTKLNLRQVGAPTGTGSEFEQSLLRNVAAALGISFEQFSRDYTKTNYSSARASMAETWKFMQSRKRIVADRVATIIYRAWIEEQINLGTLPLPKGKTSAWIYEDPFILDALSRCTWIGAARGQIDEMKETQAAILRINAGLSTIEMECARLGTDWREILEQKSREQQFIAERGIVLSSGAEKAVVSKKPSDDDDEL